MSTDETKPEYLFHIEDLRDPAIFKAVCGFTGNFIVPYEAWERFKAKGEPVCPKC